MKHFSVWLVHPSLNGAMPGVATLTRHTVGQGKIGQVIDTA